MKSHKVASVEDYKIVSSFQTLRRTLLEERFADRWEKPLAYWALPNDRRLPLAFLGRTIKDLLHTPFEELSDTPGIGQKKISSLVKLLSRATKDHPPAAPFVGSEPTDGKKNRRAASKFDPAIVSEALWSQWTETVRRHNVGHEKLGRLAPTLQALPTVIWHTPLSHYIDRTVAEIRQLRTHGEKRVRVVLEVVWVVNEVLGKSDADSHLSVRLVPKFIEPIEQWLSAVLEQPGLPDEAAVRKHLVLPLLAQMKVDSGDEIHDLVAGRLGAEGPVQSVRQQARRLNLTRARVYQLLEECAKVMSVRWPEGQGQFMALSAKFAAEDRDSPAHRLFLATSELFFPGKHRLADEDTGADDE